MAGKFLSAAAIAALVAAPAAAAPKAKAAEVTLVTCEAPYGSIAIVEGDTQGWTKFGLGSPRDIIAMMAAQSNCFTLHDPASGARADFLMNAIAGDKEEVDQGVNLAKTALTEAALRSGALGQIAGRVPMVGGLMGGMLGGMGGKKKTVAAGLRVISPATGQTIISGTGDASKSSISFGGMGLGAMAAASNPYGAAAMQNISDRGYGQYIGQYSSSKDGQLLTSAFVKAFNAVVGQAGALASAKVAAAPAVQPAAASYSTAIDTQMYAAAAKGASVRALRAGSVLTPTGKREGLFVEVKDNFGTQGWVSVEDLR